MIAARASLVAGLALLAFVACSDDESPAPEPEPVTDAGSSTPDTSTGGPGADVVVGPQVDCAPGTTVEVEPNDTPETATEVADFAFCGVLSTGTDADWSTFETPAGTKLGTFQGVINGAVDFELRVGSATFGPADRDKFVAGRYLVKAFTTAGKPASYRYRIAFVPQ